MSKTITITRKIGRNRGKPRLWIEGRALVEAGLDHGALWTLEVKPYGLSIRGNPEGTRKVAGKPGRPIIDIIGASLGSLQDAEMVEITYQPGAGWMDVVPVSLVKQQVA